MSERWKGIFGFEGRYEVSDLGRVRSVARTVSSPRHGSGGTRIIQSRILALGARGSLYPMLNLVDADGNRTSKMVHRLVAEAFIPNPNNYPEVNHLDADRANNKAQNLEWCTRAMNTAHAYKIGNLLVGKDHHFARLDRDDWGRCIAGPPDA